MWISTVSYLDIVEPPLFRVPFLVLLSAVRRVWKLSEVSMTKLCVRRTADTT